LSRIFRISHSSRTSWSTSRHVSAPEERLAALLDRLRKLAPQIRRLLNSHQLNHEQRGQLLAEIRAHQDELDALR